MPQLSLEIADKIAVIKFSNPPLQVMTPQTMNELNRMMPTLRSDDVRAIVFTGTDSTYFIRHFSVEELDASASGGETGTWEVSMLDLLYELEHLPKPFITALNGSAMGGGLEFALASDIRVVKDGPHRYGLPEVSVGILPGAGGTQRLTAIVGRGRALEMMLRPRLISPQELYDYGIAQELVPEDSAETALDRAMVIAKEIAGRHATAVAHIKRLAREAVSPVTKDMLRLEGKLFAELMATEETKGLLRGVAQQHKAERSKA
jgi:enoyl-CoA hydratase